MRLLKRLAVVLMLVVVVAGLAFGFAIMQALHSGSWLDHEFAELSRNWDPQIIVRDRASAMAPADLAEMQAAFKKMRQAHLRAMKQAMCTFGPHFEFGGTTNDNGLRSQCVVWARFAEGDVRFDVELAGLGDKWQIVRLSANSEAQPDDDQGDGQ